MKQEIIEELNRLYNIEQRFNQLLEELGYYIVHKQGKLPFQKVYEKVVYKYLI